MRITANGLECESRFGIPKPFHKFHPPAWTCCIPPVTKHKNPLVFVCQLWNCEMCAPWPLTWDPTTVHQRLKGVPTRLTRSDLGTCRPFAMLSKTRTPFDRSQPKDIPRLSAILAGTARASVESVSQLLNCEMWPLGLFGIRSGRNRAKYLPTSFPG